MTTTPITTNRFSQTLSASMKSITAEEGKIARTLADYGVAFNWNSITFKREETRRNGEPKSYIPDFVIHRNLVGREVRQQSLILHVYGDGSSSKGNEPMHDFFDKLGYLQLDIPNKLASDADFRIVLAKLLAFATGLDRPEVVSK